MFRRGSVEYGDMSATAPRSPQPEPTASDREFQYLAIGMVAGALPGIIVGLLLSLSWGNPAMWVSITGGIGIIIGMVTGKAVYRRRSRQIREARRSSDGSR